MITVKTLIKELKKMPPDAIVIYQAHDNKENEIGDYINRVSVIDFDKLPKDKDQNNKGIAVAVRS